MKEVWVFSFIQAASKANGSTSQTFDAVNAASAGAHQVGTPGDAAGKRRITSQPVEAEPSNRKKRRERQQVEQASQSTGSSQPRNVSRSATARASAHYPKQDRSWRDHMLVARLTVEMSECEKIVWPPAADILSKVVLQDHPKLDMGKVRSILSVWRVVRPQRAENAGKKQTYEQLVDVALSKPEVTTKEDARLWAMNVQEAAWRDKVLMKTRPPHESLLRHMTWLSALLEVSSKYGAASASGAGWGRVLICKLFQASI